MFTKTKSLRVLLPILLAVSVLGIGLPTKASAIGTSFPCGTGDYVVVLAIVTGGSDCTGSFTIDSSAVSIGDTAFLNATGIVSVTIPSSVQVIGRYAFFGAGSLTTLSIPSSVTSIGEAALARTRSVTSFTVDPNNANFSSEGGVVFNKLKTRLIQYPIGNTAASYAFPNSVTAIDDYAFAGADSITTLTIPDSVTDIGDYTFADMLSLINLSLPNFVTSIGNYTFSFVVSLETLSIPNSVTSIGDFAFSNLYSLTTLSIPNSVSSIGIGAFLNAVSLRTLSIPSSVRSIGIQAFFGFEGSEYTYCGTALTQADLDAAGLSGKTRISVCSTTHSPLFSSASSYDGRFTAQIANYDSAFTYSASSSTGQVSINSTGLVTVTGLRPDQSVTVTVTVTRSGYASVSGSITGRSQVAPMIPTNKPTVTISDTLITCTIGSYSATPTSSAFSLFVDGKHVSTIFSALGEYLPDWIIPWATSSTITRTASLTTATWAMSDAYKGKEITCATLAYSKNAIGLIASQVMVAG